MVRILMGTILVAACTDSAPLATASDASLATVADAASQPTQLTTDGGLVLARPYNFHVPVGYDRTVPTPLVILLHGYSANGAEQELYFKLTPLSDAKGFLYAYPDGTPDRLGNRFWNATDACCNFGNQPGIDDVTYVNSLIDDVEKKYNVDPQRIFVIGHSNGGFMSHRLACDVSARVAAIVSLAGGTWKAQTHCQPTDPIAILQIHGDADLTVNYSGGTLVPGGPLFPGARETVADWATLEACRGPLAPTGMMLDLDSNIAGPETRVERYSGCGRGAVELWTIQGGSHVPALAPTFPETVYGFFAAHPKQ